MKNIKLNNKNMYRAERSLKKEVNYKFSNQYKYTRIIG
jgi:hypothetical protein